MNECLTYTFNVKATFKNLWLEKIVSNFRNYSNSMTTTTKKNKKKPINLGCFNTGDFYARRWRFGLGYERQSCHMGRLQHASTHEETKTTYVNLFSRVNRKACVCEGWILIWTAQRRTVGYHKSLEGKSLPLNSVRVNTLNILTTPILSGISELRLNYSVRPIITAVFFCFFFLVTEVLLILFAHINTH